MADVTSYVNNASPLNLALSGGETKKSTNEKTASKSFISIMLAQLTDAAKASPKSVKETVPEAKEEIKEVKTTTKAKSVDEHLLEDILKVVNFLKNGTQATSFPTLKSSGRLEKILTNETAVKDFGEVKNVSDLMALSKKYNLGLEKLSFSKESLESLKKEFPALAKSDFFQTIPEETPLEETTTDTKITSNSINPLEVQNKKNENTAPHSALKELMSKETKDEPKTTTTHQQTKIEEVAKTENIVSEDELLIVNEKQIIKEIKVVSENVESKKATSSQVEIVTQKIVAPSADEAKIDKKLKIDPLKVAETTLNEEIKQEVKTAPITRIHEVKTENTSAQKGLTETILQNIKIEKPIMEKPSDETLVTVPTPLMHSEEVTKSENTETKQSTIEVKAVQKQEITTKQPVTSRESLNQFATDLKEKIDNYKAPIMKVELALNPKNLGEVDVTLLTRGNNLHVNISSNSTTMTLFTQNQAEFKNALVNMGFTNLEMNFSDQRESGQQQSQHNNQKSSGELYEEFTTEQASNENTASIEVVIPRYV